MPETDAWTLLAIAGMTVVTVVARSFFFISQREWRLPDWAQRGLQYAPIAALAAVIAPDILLAEGGGLALLGRDARTWGALTAAGFYFWRRGTTLAMPGAIAAGMAAYLPLHLWLGW